MLCNTPYPYTANVFKESQPDPLNTLTQDIKVPGDQVDVNMHPTKHEVILLHQEEMIQAINDALREVHSGEMQ